ncbi:OmpA family protein [Vibrio sp. HN007]|uniref:OmpA family protein n=1 Tax=Vibrio iocasae TaxID=3098914 RepID=UPI0035D4B3E7
MKLTILVPVLLLAGITGCTSYPEHGQGGMAENHFSSGFTPVMPDQPLGPEHGLRFDWQLAKLHLEMLVQEGAEMCFPATVLQSRMRQDRIARELAAGLYRDAANDLIVQRKRLTELEQDLTYVTSQAECVLPRNSIDMVALNTNIETIYNLLNADNQFAFDSSEINPKYMGRLAEAALLLRENSQLSLTLTGHADATGNKAYNDKLANERAEQVERYLRIFGLAANRISVNSVGSANPLFEGESAGVRLTNRRVSVEVHSHTDMKGE